MNYYLYDQNTTTEPYTLEQIGAMRKAGSLSLYTLYAAAGDTQWQPIENL